MYSVNGIIGGIHAPTALDINEARHFLKKYLELDIKSVICYHESLSKDNINEHIQKVISET